jgi:hypothetical protein
VNEYDLAFAERLPALASSIVVDGIDELDAQRCVLYLSLLSTEISLKAMLEQAGKPVQEIQKRSHKLSELLKDLGQCEIQINESFGCVWVSAVRLRSCVLTHGAAKSTVEAIIDAESKGASQYPSKIRYSAKVRHFPPQIVAQIATRVAEFARKNWGSIRIKS